MSNPPPLPPTGAVALVVCSCERAFNTAVGQHPCYHDRAEFVALPRAAHEAREKDIERLRAALIEQRERWEQLPGGVDYAADPANLSPEDSAAHIGGLAIQAIDALLGGGS